MTPARTERRPAVLRKGVGSPDGPADLPSQRARAFYDLVIQEFAGAREIECRPVVTPDEMVGALSRRGPGP
jgi:hypothetical protein